LPAPFPLSSARLEAILNALPRLTIGLVGDLFLDRYLELTPQGEISIETGLEAYQVQRVRNSPGALGTVMNNLAALGVGLLVPTTVIGDDGHGYDLLREVRRLPVDPLHIICSPHRLTPTYTKPLQPVAAESRELNRLDVRSREPLDPALSEQLCQRIEKVWQSSDGLIVLDQINEPGWGVINDQVRGCLRILAATNPNKLVYVDSRRRLADFDFGVLKGNQAEVATAADLPSAASREQFQHAASQMATRTQQPMFCTLGDQGTLVAEPNGRCTVVPALEVSGPVDIVGAGDATTSGIVTALLCGASPVEAAALGNLIASITIRQLGATGTATPAQLREALRASA
jgi:bifunctional ADP-heptose synthase (sugar kinase/adenylyltransferase)